VSKTEKYITIPHSISRNSNLHFGARLLYGEILLLGRKHGYCWASNAYLSELLSVSEKTITRWIKALENEGFIYTDSKLTKDGTNRKLMIKAKGQECPLAEKPRDTGVQSQGTSVSKPRDIRVQAKGHPCPKPRDTGVHHKNTRHEEYKHEEYKHDDYDKKEEVAGSKNSKTVILFSKADQAFKNLKNDEPFLMAKCRLEETNKEIFLSFFQKFIDEQLGKKEYWSNQSDFNNHYHNYARIQLSKNKKSKTNGATSQLSNQDERAEWEAKALNDLAALGL